MQFIGQRIHGFRREFERNRDGMDVVDQKVMLRRFAETLLDHRRERRGCSNIKKVPGVKPQGTHRIRSKNFLDARCSLNGNRTRILALRGLRPRPLDDKAG
jgi:hypothetical protein